VYVGAARLDWQGGLHLEILHHYEFLQILRDAVANEP
jgi:hypothetical protein